MEYQCKCGKERAWDEEFCPECQKEGMMEKKTELVEKPGNLPKCGSPAEMIAMVFGSGGDVSQLRELLTIQKDYEANEARKAFHQAMARFKENAPVVTKDKTNSQYNSKYTSLNNLVNTINPALSKQGLTASWNIEQNGTVKVTCKLTHSLGHSEGSSMSADADTSGAKNKIQQIKSTITYLKAVTFESICGLASTDANMDDDGNTASIVPIGDKELGALRDLLISANLKEGPLCKFFKIDALEDLPKEKYGQAVNAIKSQKEQK